MTTTPVRPPLPLPEAIAAPRYLAEYPLPKQRYIPGCGARPDEILRPTLISLSPTNWSTHATYLRGCDLHNHGFFWEAHEEWEATWHLSEKGTRERALLQGLIQLTASQVKRRQHDTTNARRLAEGSARYLNHASGGESSPFLGLSVARLVGVIALQLERDSLTPWPLIELVSSR